MLQNQHFKCQRQRLGHRWARVCYVLQDGLTMERKAITHHLVPVMAPQLLWHSLSPVILGQRLFLSFFHPLSALIYFQLSCEGLASTSRQRFLFPVTSVFGLLSGMIIMYHRVRSSFRYLADSICVGWLNSQMKREELQDTYAKTRELMMSWCNLFFFRAMNIILTTIMDVVREMITHTHTSFWQRPDCENSQSKWMKHFFCHTKVESSWHIEVIYETTNQCYYQNIIIILNMFQET